MFANVKSYLDPYPILTYLYLDVTEPTIRESLDPWLLKLNLLFGLNPSIDPYYIGT